MYRAFHPSPHFHFGYDYDQFSRLTSCLLLHITSIFNRLSQSSDNILFYLLLQNKLIYTYTHLETFEGGCVERVEAVIVTTSNVCVMVLVVKFAGGICPKYYMPKPTTFDKVVCKFT